MNDVSRAGFCLAGCMILIGAVCGDGFCQSLVGTFAAIVVACWAWEWLTPRHEHTPATRGAEPLK